MTFRRPSQSLRNRIRQASDAAGFDSVSGTARRARRLAKRRDEKRRTLVESLESRQLLAGPELIGIQPNEGDLLTDGETLTFSPNELVFRFDDDTFIDESSLGAIRITRAGEDGVFESASATSDLGTGGVALFQFRARESGSLGNGITILFTATDRAGSQTPIITVNGETITVNLNLNSINRTQAGDVISAINNSSLANTLIEAIQVSGSSSQPVGSTDFNGTSLVLDGANAAQAVTDFGSNGAVRVRFISQLAGVDGRGTVLEFEQRDFGGPANPVILINEQTIRIQLNSFAGAPTTAAQLVDRLNNDPRAAALISASVQEGEADTVIGTLPTTYSPLTLSGVSDIVVEPGFVGLGDSSREVVFRFAEPLPDDRYQINILGSGAAALRNLDGEAFQDGENFTRPFNINLGPQVVAVVPEPMRREANGSLSVDVGIIEVHFNDDDLDPTLVRDRSFYQLIYTRDTVENTDDIVVPLVSDPVYNSITNVVRLNYGQSLARLPSTTGDFGTARLRIGSRETSLPPAPQAVTLPTGADDAAGDSFASAFDLNAQWSISTGVTSSAFLTTEIRNENPFGLELPGPDLPGTREIRPEDPSRLTRVEPLDFTRRGADDFDGITQLRYNFVGSWLGDDPNRPGIVDDTTYFNIISTQQQQRVREILSLYSEYLGVSFTEVSDQSQGAIVDISIAVGDLYGGDVRATSGQGGTTAVLRSLPNGAELVVLDFQDFDESNDDQFGEPFFDVTMDAVGQLLGYGNDRSLPQPGEDYEPIFPSYAEIVHGQYLFRPDSTDIDLYRVELPTTGSITIETIAERLGTPSTLDTHLRLYRETPSGVIELAGNDDYVSNDSLIRLDDLDAGVYFIGVSAQGNDTYDPVIPGTGFGGLTEGTYELRVDFTPSATATLSDTDGIALDGDADGRPGGEFNFWFKPADANSEVLYVDKGDGFLNNPSNPLPSGGSDLAFVDAFRARGSSMGTIGNPYSEIDRALADASRLSQIRQQSLLGEFAELNALRTSDPQAAATIENYLATLDVTIRIVGNGGLDRDVSTAADNFSYQIGFDGVGFPLEDGTTMELPADVQLVIDSGAILKFSRARIGVGSVAPTVDISGSNLQVLGTPTLINSGGLPARDATGAIIPGSVFFTSINDSTVGIGNQLNNADPQPGDWGGIDFFGELDAADELRTDLEREGIFLNHIQYADLRFGGGAVTVGGNPIAISPIELSTTRATVINSSISQSADAAISATPDTFREDRFTDFFSQDGQRFTPDYDRVGPEIHGNTIVDNSINGLFVRIQTRSGEFLRPLTTAARFDDTDITHVLTENLVIEATPGGNIVQSEAPSTIVVRGNTTLGQGSVPAGTYVYRIANVDSSGLESAPSADTVPFTLAGTGSVTLRQLPTALPGSATVGRRLYRAEVVNGTAGTFRLVATLNATTTTFTDRLSDTEFQLRPVLQDNASPVRARLDASLTIDPSTIVKLDAARIEARFGANLLAEGLPGNPVVFTSLEDQRYGRGGTFDTNNRGNVVGLSPGDWGGIYVGQGGFASLDNVVVAGGGGATRVEGGFASFNAIEVHQGDLRLTNSRLEHNADGRGTPNGTRVGRLDNAPGALVVRAAQPIVINNDFIDNETVAISVDLNSLNSFQVEDYGRSTGVIERFGDEESEAEFVANYGPFVQDNTLTRNLINGMQVRGGTLATEGVWDDVDIVHVVTESIDIPNKHIFGGLRLLSDARGSLIVKFETINEDNPAGIVVGGDLLSAEDQFVDIPDRIGGSLQLLGHPDFPVVLTGLNDSFVGAGFDIDGLPQVGTDPSSLPTASLPTGPEVNLGTTIDNDVDDSITGSFGATIGDANDVFASDVTVVDAVTGQQLLNQNYIFRYSTFLTANGATVALADTTVTQPATLVADDRVESRGTYDGPNGTVNWIATSFFVDGVATLFSTLDLESNTALGQIDIVSYLDEDINAVNDDLLYTVGTPGQADFRVFTVDGPLRVGFSHGGFYFNDGVNQSNAVYQGWAADKFIDLQLQIEAATQTYSIPGVIDLVDLPPGADPVFGQVFGPNDVTTAHAWRTNNTALNARVTSFLELLSSDPSNFVAQTLAPQGVWDGVTIREGADDRNVAAAAETEPVRTTVFDANDQPGQAQFLGELAPNEQSSDENRRLGFVVDGAISTRDDIDVYSFVAEANTEVWLDIDRTSNSLDTVIELIDINGVILASSNDSLAAEIDVDTGIFVSNRIDPDAAQALTVNELRVGTQQISIDSAIQSATSGNLTFGVEGTTTTVNVAVADFNADPAGSIANALNSAFQNELGFVNTRLLARGATDDFVIEVGFDPAVFASTPPPNLTGTSNPVFPPIAALTIESIIPTSVLQDAYSSNAKDAGMRIRLPGEIGTRNTYHVRVRSSNTPDPSDFATLTDPALVDRGLTLGRYQMQIRLGETDESPGTQIRFADVRFATTAVQVIGQPLHSPLLGEEGETTAENGTASLAQRLGFYGEDADAQANADPLQSDRLAKSIAGTITEATDVDFYQFEVSYEDVPRDGAPLLLSTVIDLDYASNFARSDMAIYLFDGAGNLIYTATDSNVAGDLPTSQSGNSSEDLSRGSAGSTDPFLGSVELDEGTYFLAVSNQTQVPLSMDQFFNPASNNPLVRLQPIAATDRVAVDNANNGVLFDTSSIVPYSLDDVVLYVNTPTGLHVVNPLTGENYGQIGNFGGEDIYDVAFRSNGELFGYTGFADRQRSDQNWFYVQIDTGDASLDQISAGAGITTFGDLVAEVDSPQILDFVVNEGLFVEAVTIREYKDVERGVFVGNRNPGFAAGLQYTQNVLYEFSPETGLATGPDFNLFVSSSGAGTLPREIGSIDTSPPANPLSTQLGVTDVLEFTSPGIQSQRIFDGDAFTLTAGMDTTVFEFDFGGDVLITGAPILDGDTLVIGGTTFEFDTGARLMIEEVDANGGLDVGQSVTVQSPSGGFQRFEFVDQGGTPNFGGVPITIRLSDGQARSPEAIANDLALAIQRELPDTLASVLGDEINFQNGTTFQTFGAGVNSVGNDGVAFGNIAIDIDETSSSEEVLTAIVDALTNESIPVTTSGLTFNVPGAASVAVNSQGLVGGGAAGVTVGRTPIILELDDLAIEVADKIALAINNLGGSATATALNRSVAIGGGFITSVSGNLVAGGVPNGGTITGAEFIGNDLYAISDNGSLFRVTDGELTAGSNQFVNGARTIGSYVTTATDLLRLNEDFTGLRAGPNSVSGGAYSNVLFGITSSGNIYAFNTAGELLPYFAGGVSMISTGVANAQGLDFSTLDYNLWHFTNTRGEDPGHGETGGTPNRSLAFSYETSFQSNYSDPVEFPTATPRRDGQGVNQTYNFPGGAKGAIQSQTFSLADYSPSDLPTLYFNYLIEADGGGGTDALRVYVVEPDGTEHAVALNTTARGIGSADDEFDDPPVVAPYNDTIDVDKQQLFDNTDTWRQARVSLSEFAGLTNLSLRIEFTTAGRFATASTTVRAVAASDLVEGELIRISGQAFTVDFPPTLITPQGSEIADAYSQSTVTRAEFTLDGQVYVLNDGTRTINVGENEIDLTAGLTGTLTVADLSSAEISAIIVAAVNANPPVVMNYNIADLGNAVEFGEAMTLTSNSLLLDVRNTTVSGGNTIDVRAEMTAVEVAEALRDAIIERFFSTLPANAPDLVPINGAVLSLPGFSVGSTGPFANANQRFADQFGASQVAGARDNDFEGVYLDDFIIGLAERGEQVVDSRPAGSGLDTLFVTDTRFTFPEPDDPRSSLDTGSYQIEIRDGSEYISSGPNVQFRSFDSNDRLDGGVQITARPAFELSDGDFFSITDGRSTVEFEFDSNGSVTAGRVPVPFSLSVFDDDTGLPRAQTATEVAASIIDAINRSDVQSVLVVTASPGAGFQNVAPPTAGIKNIEREDAKINLVGNVVVTDLARSFASVEQFDHRGDANRDRDSHGVILIENSRFLLNEQYGIDIQHDISADVAGTEGPTVVRYPRNLVELNVDNYVPGVVVQSNVLAFNGAGGLQLKGIDGGLDQTQYDPVSAERIVNNTIIGGTITPGLNSPSATFEGILFDQGTISFADRVVVYDPSAGGSPPSLIHQIPNSALGLPDGIGRGAEPVDGETSVSLGIEGTLTVEFTNNFLTGSGDARGDLVIFEDGEVESVRVEISRDGITFFDVGNVGGLTNQIDLDAFGFGPNDRFAFVRVTDERQGNNTGTSLGADIDAIGAISSVPVDSYNASGVGISIIGNASPFVLNNVIANSEVGVEVSGVNPGFISGGNAYYQNISNTADGVSLGQIPQLLTDSEAVFVNPTELVFAPASGARIVDSSIDSLPDRDNLTTVRNAVGIPPSPILAPNLDVNGQVRVDDPNVEPPSGLGDQVFKDRGAFDRGDLSGPRVTLLSPFAPGIGLDSGRATVTGSAPQAFEIQLVDGLPPADFVPGTGIDDGSVSSSSLILLQDGVPLIEGTDYRFGYNPSTNTIRLTPIAGVWEDDSTYVIRMVDASDSIIQAGEGNVYEDGETLTVTDSLGEDTVFEYETGIIVDLFPTLTGVDADGIQLVVFDGNITRTFELDSNNAVLPISTRVPIEEAGSSEDFIAALAVAINADTQLNMAAFANGPTLQLLGGTPLSTATSNTNFVQVAGTIGTSTGFGFQIPLIEGTSQADVFDGQSISVSLGSVQTVVFEFNSDGLLVNGEATSVPISSAPTLDEVANALVIAIGGSTLGLAPTNAGFGRVFLGGDNTYSIDLSNSDLTEIGLPGDGPTVPILIPVDQTSQEVALIIQGAIDNENLPGVTTSIVDDRVFLEGAGGVIGFGAADRLVVQDEVGNQLQSNQSDGRTELIIFIGTGFDYGDAPAPYTSTMVDGGPRHRVDPLFSLGVNVSADSDAELPNADTFDDGITLPTTFQAGFSRSVGINLNNADGRTAFVDAWFDWNQNGQFDDNEQVTFATGGASGRTPIAPGGNSVLLTVPADAVPGQTFARFRLSESPVLGPEGDGGFGEVEDYSIVVTTNPFTNPSNRFDTNGSGTVTPLDALVVVNAIGRANTSNGEVNLEVNPVTTPPFPDVNGDGRMTSLDALQVINHLQRLISGEGEGELTGSFLSAGPGVLASGSTAAGDLLLSTLLRGEGSDEDDSNGSSASADRVSTLSESSSSKVSVFDSAASMQLDSIVDQLAEDKRDAEESAESDESDLDAFFAGL